jgi:hypothetical protein
MDFNHSKYNDSFKEAISYAVAFLGVGSIITFVFSN